MASARRREASLSCPQAVCGATPAAIVAALQPLLAPLAGFGGTFAVQWRRRHNTAVDKESVIREVAAAVHAVAPKATVNLRAPSAAVVIEARMHRSATANATANATATTLLSCGVSSRAPPLAGHQVRRGSQRAAAVGRAQGVQPARVRACVAGGNGRVSDQRASGAHTDHSLVRCGHS